MRLKLHLLYALFLLASACVNSMSAMSQADPRTQVPHIDAKKALQLFRAKKLILLDVHPGQDKRKSDIVGALFVPSTKLSQIKLNVRPEILVGVFCNCGPAEGYSAGAALSLRQRGYKNVVVIYEGQPAMIKAGFPYYDGKEVKVVTPLGNVIRLYTDRPE